MLLVQKGNRQLTIIENDKEAYLSRGYDLLDEEGNILEHATNKTVSISEYKKLEAELEELKAPKTKSTTKKDEE